jgi:electron transfer flavoprotein alpha subunit
MRALLLGEHANGVLSPSVAKAVNAFAKVQLPLDLLLLGNGSPAMAVECSCIQGVSKVIFMEDDGFDQASAGACSEAILSLAGDYALIAACTSRVGKDAMPRVAAALDVMQISGVIEIVNLDEFRRPVYAGALIQTVKSRDPVRVLTIEPGSFVPAPVGGSAPVEEMKSPSVSADRSIEHIPLPYHGPDLQTAGIVVAGGRGLGSKARFDEVLLPLAKKLDAAVGASRAAVDLGYAPNECQVGQTGKSISPELYIACGISGAVQHVTGIRDAKIVVAINSDPEAAIFHSANIGIVGDLFEIVPEFTRKIS